MLLLASAYDATDCRRKKAQWRNSYVTPLQYQHETQAPVSALAHSNIISTSLPPANHSPFQSL